MINLNKKIVTTMLIIFFLLSITCFISKKESKGLEYGVFSYILFFNHSKITRYDYILVGILALGLILNFVYIFYKNIYLINFYSLIIGSLSIFVYLKKSEMKYE
ncbi:hypothetical protein [Clostridium tyrobutyricum]|uniref:hypothetical protein n=1 Tax=Clostridium tyrobutyricum TaxID=1519 RepID=UPI001C38332E|nr:hypothetical protein [Clostridium tyrobutyricum]MBV4423304.1 hypothetical protein [Clostridium tyrobutyricum]